MLARNVLKDMIPATLDNQGFNWKRELICWVFACWRWRKGMDALLEASSGAWPPQACMA